MDHPKRASHDQQVTELLWTKHAALGLPKKQPKKTRREVQVYHEEVSLESHSPTSEH